MCGHGNVVYVVVYVVGHGNEDRAWRTAAAGVGDATFCLLAAASSPASLDDDDNNNDSVDPVIWTVSFWIYIRRWSS